MFKVITDHPVAYDSPDHFAPQGAKLDNSTYPPFVTQLEAYFGGRKLTCMDFGCAGGGHAIQMLERGHQSIGLEGSNYNAVHEQFHWPKYYNTNLFTCDVSYPFEITLDDEPAMFDCITAWEVMEHIRPEAIDFVIGKMKSMLKPGGVFIGSVTSIPAPWEGHEHHLTIQPKDWWNFKFAEFFSKNYTNRFESPIPARVRYSNTAYEFYYTPQDCSFMAIKE